MGEGAGCGGGERAGDKGRVELQSLVVCWGKGVPGARKRGPGVTEEARHKGSGALPPQVENRRVGWKSRQVFTLACLSDVS